MKILACVFSGNAKTCYTDVMEPLVLRSSWATFLLQINISYLVSKYLVHALKM